jgi:transglutaminase-like putative cysteine protease
MKTKTLFTIACLCACLCTFSQELALPEFGKINIADLSVQECSFEKDAGAFYLLNYAKTKFRSFYDGSYEIITERRVRIKILNQKGFQYAAISIPHFGNKHDSKITDIEAFVYTTDTTGTIVKTKVEKKDIFKSIVSDKSNLRMVKFTFPGLKPGCIIEYRYEHIENDTYSVTPWFFQDPIPVALSYYEINYPKISILDYRIVGNMADNKDDYKEWPVDSSKDVFKKIFLMKNIHSFKIEPLMSSFVDNLKRIEFSLNPDPGFLTRASTTADMKWRLASTRLSSSLRFGTQFGADLPGTEKVIDSIRLLKTKKDKIRAVYQYVKKEVTWDTYQSMYPDDVITALKNKTGNSADINILILNLLRKSGVDCYPVLISTRENGKPDPSFPHTSQFNGIDVLVIDSANYYVLDGSIKNQSYLIPPLNVVNRDVFIIMPDSYKWVNITETRPLIKDSIYVDAILNKEGYLNGEASTTYFNLSRDLRLTKDAEKEKNAKESAPASDLIIDSSWLINDKDSGTLPLAQHSRFHLSLNATGNFYFLNPFLFSFFEKNPFVDSTRLADIDFRSNQQFIQVMRIAIPQEIELETIPKSIVIRTADTSMLYSRKINQRGNKLWIENEFSINRSIYDASEYSALWLFFKKVYALLGEEIVLNKKN